MTIRWACTILCVTLIQIALGVKSASAQPTSTVCSYGFAAAETGWRSHTWTAADCSNGLPQAGWTGVGQGLNGSGTAGQVSCTVTAGSHYNNPATHGATNGTVRCLFAPPASASAHPSPDVTTCRYTFAEVADGWRSRYWVASDCTNGLPAATARAVGQGQTGTGDPGMVMCEPSYASHYTHPYASGATTATVTCTYVAPTQVAAPEFTRCSYGFDYYYSGWQTRTWVAADCSHGLPAAGAWGIGQAVNGNGGPQQASCTPTTGSHYNPNATIGGVSCLYRNPAVEPCTSTITPATESFTADGGTASVAVTSGSGCSWSSTAQATWITIVGAGTGAGNGSVSYSVQPNATAQPREGTIVIAGKTLTVSQAAGAASTQATSTVCSYTFSASETGWRSHTWIAADCSNGLPQAGWSGVGQGLNGTNTSGQVSCQVTSGSHYNNPATHGATTGTVRCLFAPPASASAHPSPDVTTCKHTFADVADGWRSRYWVSADCSNGLPAAGARAVGQGQTPTGNPGMVICEPAYGSHYTHPYLDGASTATVTCTYVAPTQTAFPEFTRCSYGFNYYYTGWQTRTWTAADCSHGLPSPDAWGVGNATNGAGGAQMASCTPSTGSHYNPGQTVGAVTCLYRNPTPASGCSYAITPATQSFASGAATGSVSVTGGAGCSWWVTSHASWISITGGATGTGNGSVSYSVQANPTTQPRESTIVVAGQTLTVSQAASAACTSVTLSPGSMAIGASAGTGSFTVSAAPLGCSWSASSAVSWISESGDSSTGVVSYVFDQNTAPSVRSGSIVVGNATFAVTQSAASPAVPMMTAIYDTFTGDTWTPLTSHMPDIRNVGGNWSVSSAVPVLHSGTLKIGAHHPSLKSTALIDTGSSDSIISVDWSPTSASSTNSGYPLGVVVVRALDDNNFIAAGYGLWGGHYLALAKYDDGEWTLLGSADPGPHTGMRHLDVKVSGTSIQVWSDGVLMIQTLEGMFGDGTKQGVLFWPAYDWLSGFDNFTIAIPQQAPPPNPTPNNPNPNPQPTGCNVSLSPTQVVVGSSASTGSFEVSAASGCSWTATTTASFLQITSGQNYVGAGVVHYSITSNDSAQQRIAFIFVNNGLHAVLQPPAVSGASSIPLGADYYADIQWEPTQNRLHFIGSTRNGVVTSGYEMVTMWQGEVCECEMYWESWVDVWLGLQAPDGSLSQYYLSHPILAQIPEGVLSQPMPGQWNLNRIHRLVRDYYHIVIDPETGEEDYVYSGSVAHPAYGGFDVSLTNPVVVPVSDARLTLLLDVDGNFNPGLSVAGQDDAAWYVPGAEPGGASAALPQSIKLIAVYTNGSGTVLQPPPNATVTFSLADTSAFNGSAMNGGSGTAPDYSLAGTTANFGSDRTARVDLLVHDYGGFTKVNAASGSTSTQLSVPKDSNLNGLPDAGWSTSHGHVPDTGNESDDSEPGGARFGDGLAAWQEYRGFMIGGQHRRLNPAEKDLFVNNNVFGGGAGDAPALGVHVHVIDDDEMTVTNEINAHYNNLGQGPQPSGHYDQRALKIRDHGYHATAMGEILPPVEGMPPAFYSEIRIYTQRLRELSPPINDITTMSFPIDTEKLRQTIGHEIGHGVGLRDLSNSACPPPTVTVMLTNYFGRSNGNDAAFCAWQNIPHVYTAHELATFILR